MKISSGKAAVNILLSPADICVDYCGIFITRSDVVLVKAGGGWSQNVQICSPVVMP